MPLTTPKSNIFSNSSWRMEIASKDSPLSRWWGQSLVRLSEFRLEFKPKLDPAESEQAEPPQMVVVKGNPAQLESLSQLTEAYVQNLLVQSVAPGALGAQDKPIATLAEDDPAFPDDMPEWQADDRYSHRLYLGSLQVEPLMSELTVTTTQLHDLSEILQEALLSVQPPTVRSFPMRSPSWPKTAAVAVAALGLTGGLAWYVSGRGTSLQTASEPEQELVSRDPAQPTQPNTGLGLPPNFPAQPTQPQIPNPNSSTKELPTTRKPNVVVPTTPVPDASAAQNKPSVTDSSKAKTSRNTKKETADSVKRDDKAKPSPLSEPSLGQSESESAASLPKTPSKAENSPAVPNGAIANSGNQPSILNETQPQIASTDSEQSVSGPEASDQVTTTSRPPGIEVSAPGRLSAANRAPNSAPNIFGTDPAVASENVRSYFQSQWQGQDSLNQSLAYQIEVKPDGTVGQVTPKSDFASVQRDQTPVPATGTQLTSPFNSPNPISFDVTLYPDGTVSVK